MKAEFWKWPEVEGKTTGVDCRNASVITAGIDIGAISSKAAILSDGKLAAYSILANVADSQAFYSREVIELSLEACNVLKLNEEELQVLAHLLSMESDELRLLHDLSQRFNLELIALTKGAGGSLMYSQERIYTHEGYKTEVVDTVGSGDAFTAALALGMLSGSDLRTINDYANRVASFVCSKRGATPPVTDDLKIT